MRATSLVPDPTVVSLEEIIADDGDITLVLRTCRRQVCAQPATRAHSWYTRRLADLPWQSLGMAVRLHTWR